MADEAVIRVEGLRTVFGPQVVHDGLDLEVRRGEVLGIVGGSGTGKSVLVRTILGLRRPDGGRVEVFGEDPYGLDVVGLRRLQRRWGVLFQDGALFSALSVAQNVQVPMREHLALRRPLIDELTAIKVSLVGLPCDAGPKLPAELSGGMRKRAGLARALALDPELLFLDEPTAGLDPIGAAGFDDLIRRLRASLGLTVVVVTHDLDTLYSICDRIAVVGDGRILACGPLAELLTAPHPWIREYFHGPRGRAAASTAHRPGRAATPAAI